MRRGFLAVLGLPTCSTPALAHSPIAGGGQDQLATLASAALLALLWLLYLAGSRRRPPGRGAALLFHGATLLCLFAVLGPLDQWAATSASAHMSQHMLFMVVIAPLWVLSGPLPQLAAATGRGGALIWEPLLRLTRHPVLTASLHGLVIWFWHTPRFYRLALEHPWWHVLEHALFLATAGLFWWSVLRHGRSRVHWALFALLFTLMHTGFLGAVLTFARAPLYRSAGSLPDQQLAGLIMWVPGAIPYLLAAAWIGFRAYHQWRRQMAD